MGRNLMLPDILFEEFGDDAPAAVHRLRVATPAPLDIGTGGVGVAIPWSTRDVVGTSITVDEDDATLIRFNAAGFYAFAGNVGFNANGTMDPELVYAFITTDTSSNRLPKFNVGVTLQDNAIGDAQVSGALVVVAEALDPDFGALVVGDSFQVSVFNDTPAGANNGRVEGGLDNDNLEHTFFNFWRVSD